MTAIITNGGTDDTGNTTVTGETRMIVSGKFSGRASVVVEIEADSLDKAVIHTFNGRGAIVIGSVNSDKVTATIRNGDSNTSIDVSLTTT